MDSGPITGTVRVRPVPGEVWKTGPVSPWSTFGQASCTPAIFSPIASYVSTSPTALLGVVGWGDSDAEYRVVVNGIDVAGFRTSPAQRTVQISYKDSPISVPAGAIVQVLARHELTTPVTLKANLLGGI